MTSAGAVSWLLLDVGGVLEIVDDEAWAGEWSRRWASRLGITAEEFSRRSHAAELPDLAVADGGEAAYWRALRTALGASAGDLAAMRAEFWDAYCGTGNVELLDVLRELRGRVGLAILSNSAAGAREEEERRYGFAQLFDPICYSHEIGVMKPDTAAFAIALERMRADPREVLFIDDVPANVDAARALGLLAHLHVDTAETIEAIRATLA